MNATTKSTRRPAGAKEAVAVFLRSYSADARPFAISEAFAAVREAFPSLQVSDNELTAAIAEHAEERLEPPTAEAPTAFDNSPRATRSNSDAAPADVRAAISAFLLECQKEAEPFAAEQALGAIRRIFPALDISDEELTDAIASEANVAGFDIDYDEAGSPRQIRRKSLEEWDNEGGAGKPNRARPVR